MIIMTKKKSKKSIAKKPAKKILIAGVNETDIDSIVEMVLKTNKKYLPGLSFAKLPDFSTVSNESLTEKREEFYSKFQTLLSRKNNVIVSGNLTYVSKLGVAPLFTPDFFTSFSPDLTILLEMDTRDSFVIPGYGIVKRKISMKQVKLQQELNRYYASMLFSPVKIIQIKKQNIKKALRDLKEIILSTFNE